MENVAIDSAILLEGEIKRRVSEIVQGEIQQAMVKYIGEIIRQEKESLIMEVAMGVGKIIRLAEEENRRPLWHSTPEEFGLTQEDLNRSHLSRAVEIPTQELNKDITNARDNSVSN